MCLGICLIVLKWWIMCLGVFLVWLIGLLLLRMVFIFKNFMVLFGGFKYCIVVLRNC